MATKRTPEEQAKKDLESFLKKFQAACKNQAGYFRAIDECDRVWEAVLEPNESDWQSNLHPPYALQTAEMYLSNLVVDTPTEKIRARVEGRSKEQAARYMQILVQQQRDKDRFPKKWYAFCKQAVIRPLTVAKVAWAYETRTVMSRTFGNPTLGFVGEKREFKPITVKNQPTFVPVDAKRFYWDPAATSMEDAAWVMWRDYVDYDDLLALQEHGSYENVDKINKDEGLPFDASDEDRACLRGRVEVIECWTKDRLVVVANRRVIIRDEENPLGHGSIPFVTASLIPYPFRFWGVGLMQIVADHQIALWDLQNQRIDNTKQLANAVWAIDPSVDDDIDSIFPGARLPVRPDQIAMLAPNISILGPSVQAEQMTRGDMGEISGIDSFTGGSGTSQVDQMTATGYQLAQNVRQQRIIMGKQQVMDALHDASVQWIKLNQNLLSVPVALRSTGAPDAEWIQVSAADIQGEFDYELEDVAESLNRQERRTEALTKIQVFAGLAPLLQAQGMLLDAAELIKDATEAFGERPDKYLVPIPPQAPAPAPGSPPVGPSSPPGANAASPLAAGGAPGFPSAPPGAPAA